jgi:hypothetical protein
LSLLGCFLLPGTLSAAEDMERIAVEMVELTARLEPSSRIIDGKAILTIRSHAHEEVSHLTFRFFSPHGPGVEVRRVWDREESLAWRRLRREEDEGEYLLQVSLTKPLRPGHKILLGFSFEIYSDRVTAPDPLTLLSATVARLRGVGWYPLPAWKEELHVGRVRLEVRLPRQWVADSALPLKKTAEATLLATYEVEWVKTYPDNTDPSVLLFGARAPQPPE